MVNWSKPDLDSIKSAFPGEVRALATNAAKLSYSGDTNIPSGVIQWDDTNKEFEKYNGSTYDPLAAWDAFASLTVTPSAGSWTPSVGLGQIKIFQQTAIIEFAISGSLSAATAAIFTITTTGPALPNHNGLGGGATNLLLADLSNGNICLATHDGSGNNFTIIRVDGSNHAIAAHQFVGTLIVPIA
jgi:hypothetical protein